jgi:hypothetical protein
VAMDTTELETSGPRLSILRLLACKSDSFQTVTFTGGSSATEHSLTPSEHASQEHSDLLGPLALGVCSQGQVPEAVLSLILWPWVLQVPSVHT